MGLCPLFPSQGQLSLAAPHLLTLLSPTAMPKLVGFSLFPAALPCPLYPCPGQTEPFPCWAFACCCSQHCRVLGLLFCLSCLPCLPFLSWLSQPVQGHCVLPRWAVLKRGASLPSLKINGLGSKELLGKPLCFMARTQYLQELWQE